MPGDEMLVASIFEGVECCASSHGGITTAAEPWPVVGIAVFAYYYFYE